MKHVFFSLFLLLAIGQMNAQQGGTLVVFSEAGDPFFLVVNGLQYNQTAQTNVRADNISMEFVKVKILFQDQAKGTIDANAGVKPFTENTYAIKLNKKGEYKLAWRGEAPLQAAQPAVVGTPPPPPVQGPANGTVTTTVVTQQTTTQTDGVVVGMAVPDGEGGTVNVGVTMSVPGGIVGGSTTTTVTQQTTTTTGGGVQPQQQPVANARCAYPMAPGAFSQAQSQIANQGFDETRLSIAKQVAQSNCMTAAQIRDVMRTFGFDETRLEFAKFAYPFSYDPNNYFMVNDAFQFEASAEELARFTRP